VEWVGTEISVRNAPRDVLVRMAFDTGANRIALRGNLPLHEGKRLTLAENGIFFGRHLLARDCVAHNARCGLLVTSKTADPLYATLFTAYGVALLWCVKGIEHKSKLVYFLAATFFVGGLARIVSIAAVGLPHPFFVAMTALELVLPVIIAFMQFRVSRAAYARQGLPADAATRCG